MSPQCITPSTLLRRRNVILTLPLSLCLPPLFGRPLEPGLVQAAEDVFWVDAANAEAGIANHGQVAHTGVVVAPKGLVVIDPGPSFKSGRMLRELLQDRLHRRVVAVVNTHPHPENVLANGAFAGLPIYASRTTRRLMARRCPVCLKHLGDSIGEDQLSGTRIVLPTHELTSGRARTILDVPFDVLVFEHAHSQGDLALFHHNSQTVFGGGLGYRNRVPEMQEASALGWLEALRLIQAWPIRRFIGSGVGYPGETLIPTRAYLLELVRQVAAQIRSGGEIGNVAVGPRSPWSAWQEWPRRHALNVQHVWHELEDLWWKGGLPRTFQ